VFAAGWYGDVYRSRGSRWVSMSSPTIANLMSVWGSGPRDVFAFDDQGEVLHYDGTGWTLTMPPFLSYSNVIHDLWGTGPNDVFGVGDGGEIDHYDGTSWSEMSTGVFGYFSGVWGSGSSDVWACGWSGQLAHWNGASWSAVASGTTTAFLGIWGSSASDIFVVGANGTIRHYDGTTWSPMSSGTTADLVGVWGSAPNDVFATGPGTFLHYDGATWSQLASVNASYLFGNGPDDVVAVGATIFQYDGTRWSPMGVPVGAGINDVWGAHGRYFAVGGTGTILERGRPCALSETSCGDGADDDCDGMIDCADPDCATDATCTAGGLCAGAATIHCGDVVPTDVTTPGASAIDRYACDPWTEKGPEKFYRLDAAATGQVNVSLSGMSADLDLVVLAQDANGACEPKNPGCITASSTRGNESVSFSATAGKSYYLVVDGFGNSSGGYTLQVSCP
jgi:hypothetical protein